MGKSPTDSRSLRRSVFQVPLSANPFLAVSLGVAILAHIAALHLPFMQLIFDTTPLSLGQWVLVMGVGSVVVVVAEIDKALLRRREGRRVPERSGISHGDRAPKYSSEGYGEGTDHDKDGGKERSADERYG